MGQFKDWAVCLDCGERRIVKHREWIRASRPRCLRCGGPIEPSSDAQNDMARHAEAKTEYTARLDRATNRQ